jgi:hypothetical protein
MLSTLIYPLVGLALRRREREQASRPDALAEASAA